MTDLGSLWDLLILVLVAFIPALVYLGWIRGTERYGQEHWGTLLRAFAYGALFATVVAAILELVIVSLGTAVSLRYPAPEFVFLNGNSNAGEFFLVLVIAPFIEEALKGSGVVTFRNRFRQLADGPVFGASVGLGFGFFETFLYGLGAYFVGGLAAGLELILIRSISSVLLHGSSTGMFGYGYARARFRQPGPGTGGYYLVAVGMHASFNALASLSLVLALLGFPGFAVDAGAIIALLAAIFFAVWAIEHVRSIIQASDYPGLLGNTVAYSPPAKPGTPGRR